MGYISFPLQKEKLHCTFTNTEPLNTFQISNIQMKRENQREAILQWSHGGLGG